MKAYRIHKAGEIRLDELPPVKASGNFVKIKTNLTSISQSDIDLYNGDIVPKEYPFILGKHAVGMVTDVSTEVLEFERGDRVFVDPFVYSLDCESCREGKYTLCENLKMYGVHEQGLLRDFSIVSANDLFKVPPSIKDEEAIYASHIALAINAASRLNLEKGDSLVIMGATVVGLFLAQVALYHHAVPIIVDSREERLSIAKEAGIYYTINDLMEDTGKRILSLTGGSLSQTLCYVSHASMPIAKSLDFVSKNGRVVVTGWSGGKTDLSTPFSQVFNKQLTVYGVNNGAKLIPSALNLLVNKTITIPNSISEVIPFSAVTKKLAELSKERTKFLKTIVAL